MTSNACRLTPAAQALDLRHSRPPPVPYIRSSPSHSRSLALSLSLPGATATSSIPCQQQHAMRVCCRFTAALLLARPSPHTNQTCGHPLPACRPRGPFTTPTSRLAPSIRRAGAALPRRLGTSLFGIRAGPASRSFELAGIRIGADQE